jgi:hypothetical protein
LQTLIDADPFFEPAANLAGLFVATVWMLFLPAFSEILDGEVN